MTRNGISKLTINPQVLKELSGNDNFQPLHLKKGSCVFFSYITVHGSASNSSPFDQTRMVVEYMSESKRHDDEKTKTFLSRRRKQERGILQSMLDSLPPI
jgi:ectoine hydroxylase-related dioxygenase (phytanoyl-CoA dioxygenase family)